MPIMLLRPVRIPANVLNVCNDLYALADLPVEFRRLDSKPTSYIPIDVPAGVPHSKTGPNAAYIR